MPPDGKPIPREIEKFDAETIYNLFGSFDAETEAPEKFQDYFVNNSFYEKFSADFPLRIAVGNKGTGKSAILRAALLDEKKRGSDVCVSLTVSDLMFRTQELPTNEIKAINHWKSVFAAEAASHLLTSRWFGDSDADASAAMRSLSELLSWIARLASSKSGGATDVGIKAGLDINKIRRITFYIDDLDKGWDGRREGARFVNSILNACYEMAKNEKNIRFKIAIRWDLWDAISSINSDIDKIRQNVVFLRWTNHQIYVVVANRIAKYLGINFDYNLYLGEERTQSEIERIFDPILERTFYGYGKWDKSPTRRVILSMTRNRPRDLISLLTLAANAASDNKRSTINHTDLQNIFPKYSEERLGDLIVEYGTRLDGLKALLLSFKPSNASGPAIEKFRFTNDRITKHLKQFISQYSATVRFRTEKQPPEFRSLLDFLYRIDFLQAWYREPDGTIRRVNFQDRQLAVVDSTEFGYSWEVLPAYRWAIQPTKIHDVIASLETPV